MDSEKLQTAFRRTLRDAPCSLRALAREAGLSHSTLLRARDGELPVSPAIVEAVVDALRRWGKRCAKLADELEAAGGDRPQGHPDAAKAARRGHPS